MSAVKTTGQDASAGTRSEYLANLAHSFPERDGRGYVIGYYIHDGNRRQAGPFSRIGEARAVMGEHHGYLLGWSIVCGHVTTAKGKLVHDSSYVPALSEHNLLLSGDNSARFPGRDPRAMFRADRDHSAPVPSGKTLWQLVSVQAVAL